MEYNTKPREVYCESCKKYYQVVDLPNPVCTCGNRMVSVISKEPIKFPSFQYVDKSKK